jgi:hypothetical protein
VTAFDVASALPVGLADPGAGPGLAASLPSPTLPTGASAAPDIPVRTIEVTVTWTEGLNDLRVVRTTYGLDLAAVQQLAESSSEKLVLPGGETGAR